MTNGKIVIWDKSYATGIGLIDNQHKELVKLTNQLYQACVNEDEAVEDAFKEAMSRMVEYVRFHFSAEQQLLERIKFPNHKNHKELHDALVKNILKAAKEYSMGRKFVPNNFVRILKDWIFGHIAYHDKFYASYVAEQKKKGLLSDKLING